MTNPVEVIRSGFVESVHRGALVAAVLGGGKPVGELRVVAGLFG